MIPNEFKSHKMAITTIPNTLQRALQIALVTKTPNSGTNLQPSHAHPLPPPQPFPSPFPP